MLACFLPFFAAKAELPVPTLAGRVTDLAGILSDTDKSHVEDAILALEKASGGQMAILIIPSLEGDSLESFSIRVAEKWKIGYKGKDDGAILIVSRDDRKIRLEIGYGWEGQVNDARAGDIIRGMGPFFKEGNYAGGFLYAVGKLSQFLGGGPAPDLGKSSETKRSVLAFFAFFVLVVIFVFMFNHISPSGRTYGGSWGSGGRGGGGGFGGSG
ncbi:MAG: hypothetical protein A2X49_05805, partial [Lentisphaerae bacterium GWF2_52_8]